eukprot:190043-Chlamydomonas_euryale.AAC.3
MPSRRVMRRAAARRAGSSPRLRAAGRRARPGAGFATARIQACISLTQQEQATVAAAPRARIRCAAAAQRKLHASAPTNSKNSQGRCPVPRKRASLRTANQPRNDLPIQALTA